MLAVIDYNAGNLGSVVKACKSIGADVRIATDAETILHADHIILPGVGAFGSCMQQLQSSGLLSPIREAIAKGTPFLGICLGMQLLFSESEEAPGIEGLNLFPGKIVSIPKSEGLKVPHMGWNELHIRSESKLLQNLPEHAYVYFVHSYYAQPEDKSLISADCDYGVAITASVEHGNVFATQFHPEKSGDVGLQILRNFIGLGGNK